MKECKKRPKTGTTGGKASKEVSEMARGLGTGPAGHTLLPHHIQQDGRHCSFASLLRKIKKTGIAFAGRFNADRGGGYDSDRNCRPVFGAGMTPNTKQGGNAVNRTKKFRKKAAGLFDGEVYKKRD